MSQKEVWDNLADEWHKYRQKPPEEVESFLKNKKGMILDLGCGSGRNISTAKNIVGIDFSEKMIKIAQKNKGGLLVVGDLRYLPFKQDTFDYAICVASLHSIKNGRKKSLEEMKRVMKKDSEAIITVWNRDQPRFNKKEHYVPWKHNGKKYMRYYYLFSQKELEKTIKGAGFDIINISGSLNKVFNLFPRNIIAIVRKK
jgi:ubiquinone/menaquinone biosynthesis C-methylase UbiE